MNKHLFDTDYGADFMRWLLIYKSVQKHKINYENDKNLNKIQEDIINNKDAALAFFFSFDFNYQLHKMQDVILKTKEPKYALLFAQCIVGADIQALQNIVISSNNIKYICKFACDVEGADFKKIENIIIRSGIPKYAHAFLKHIPSANVNKLKEIIFNSKKPKYLFELAKHVKTAEELAQIEDLIIKIGSFRYMRLLAQKNKLANVAKLEQAILDSGNAEEIKKFAKAVKKSKLNNLTILF